MPTDRFVKWTEEAPTPERVGELLLDYLGGVGETAFGIDRWICSLPGTPGQSFVARPEGYYDRERWFEVFCHTDQIDVITRMADPFTCAVADGFVQRCVEFLHAELQP